MAIAFLEIFLGLLFIASSGVLFSERFRQNKILVVCAGLVALASTYFLSLAIIESAVDARVNEITQERTLATGDDNAETILISEGGIDGSPSPPIRDVPAAESSQFTSEPVTASEPTVSVSQQRHPNGLRRLWLDGNTYGSDNHVAALRSVKITPNGSIGYRIFIQNQRGLTCDLTADGNGDPVIISNCTSPNNNNPIREGRVRISCVRLKAEFVCNGDWTLQSEISAGNMFYYPTKLTIAHSN